MTPTVAAGLLFVGLLLFANGVIAAAVIFDDRREVRHAN